MNNYSKQRLGGHGGRAPPLVIIILKVKTRVLESNFIFLKREFLLFENVLFFR